MYSQILTKLVNNIYASDYLKQKNLLEYFCNNIRKIDLNILLDCKAFIVISDRYLLNFDKDLDIYPELNIYQNGKCKFYSRLILPIWGFDNLVHSFVIYDDGHRDGGIILDRSNYTAYETLNNSGFEKGRFWFSPPNTFRKAYEEKYIAITDGVFDALALNAIDIPTVSLLSSNLTKYHREYLKFIKNWVVFADNDRAGTELFNYCKDFNNHCIRYKFNKEFKDIDEYIKLNGFNKIKSNINKAKSQGFMLDIN